MKTGDNTVLITGGATGIGFALAESFIKSGNEVIICGRREDKLKEAKAKLPTVNIHGCDISKERDCNELFDWISVNFKNTNVLLNNAGIQRSIDFRKGAEDLLKNPGEIETNFKAQIYLSALFIPMFLRQSEAAIINVSSGLGFVPLARFPVYCATKAAMHSFTTSLRYQLKGTPIKVFELIPPTVYDTELKGKVQEKNDWSISSAEVADAMIGAMAKDEYEITAGTSKSLIADSRNDPEQAFKHINR